MTDRFAMPPYFYSNVSPQLVLKYSVLGNRGSIPGGLPDRRFDAIMQVCGYPSTLHSIVCGVHVGLPDPRDLSLP